MRALVFSALVCAVLPTAAFAQPWIGQGVTPGQSIQIRELKRDTTGAVTVRFTFVNDSDRGVSGVMLRENRSDSARKPSGVKLVDEATETAYVPERGPDGQCVCSEMPNTGKGQRANLWVKFQGVPATLKTARVEVKTFEPIAGVPITGP
jgi:hypothetical protein